MGLAWVNLTQLRERSDLKFVALSRVKLMSQNRGMHFATACRKGALPVQVGRNLHLGRTAFAAAIASAHRGFAFANVTGQQEKPA